MEHKERNNTIRLKMLDEIGDIELATLRPLQPIEQAQTYARIKCGKKQ